MWLVSPSSCSCEDTGRALISLVTCMGRVLSTDMRLKVIEALLAPAVAAPAVISLLLWINLTLKRSRDSANSRCEDVSKKAKIVLEMYR